MLNFGIHFFISNIFICLFIGVLIAVKRIFKKYLSPRIQYNLWFLVFILLAIPFFPIRSVGFSQFLLWPNFSESNTNHNTNKEILAVIAQDSTLAKINDFAVSINSKTPTFVNLLFLVFWSIGILIMIILAFRSWKRLHTIEKSALPLQSRKVQLVFAECLSELGIKKEIPIYSTAFLKSPIVVGLIIPRIYLPIHLISDFNQKDMRFILLHELQHYRHKDALISLLVNLTSIFYWFNPSVWYTIKEMRYEREIACDSSVLEMLQEKDYEAYGNTLINFAEKISFSPFPFSTGIGSNMKQMKRRILTIASFKKETFAGKSRGIIIYLLISILLLGCSPVLSLHASAQENYYFDDTDKSISYIDLSSVFENYDGCFVLYDTTLDSWTISDKEAASERVTPNSTYKIYDALLGLESGVITPEHSHISWNGEDYPFDTWETGQNLKSAMQNSVNWYFQSIDSQIGFDSIKTYLREIRYGNQSTSNDLDLYWTDCSLKISPIEQIQLLKKFHDNEFQFFSPNIIAVKNAIHLTTTAEGSLYGKTGTGRIDGQDVNGWFIGYIEKPGNVYYFATNIQGKSGATGSKATEISLAALSDLNLWEQ